jgi:hypothetical protein
MDSFVFFFMLILTLPAFILPICMSPIIWALSKGNNVIKLAATFSFKPIIAIPLWILIHAIFVSDPYFLASALFHLLTLIPAVGLTIIIVMIFRHLYKSKSKPAFLLLGLDAVRWIYTALVSSFAPLNDTFFILIGIGDAIPNLVSVIALVIALKQHSKRNRAIENGAVI